jgi:hypothetical protein
VLGVDIGGDAGLPWAGEGDDGVRRGMASALVVAAAWITCRWVAGVPPELTGAAEVERAIRRPGGAFGCGILRRKDREGGIYRGAWPGEGARVVSWWRNRAAAAVSCSGWTRPDVEDRLIGGPHLSASARGGDVPLRARAACWAGPAFWHGPVGLLICLKRIYNF